MTIPKIICDNKCSDFKWPQPKIHFTGSANSTDFTWLKERLKRKDFFFLKKET